MNTYEAKVILEKLDYAFSCIRNERSDIAENIIIEIEEFVRKRNGL